MLAVAEVCRLIGVDQIHIGTAVGKMEGGAEEVVSVGEEIEHRIIKEHGHILAENWGRIKPAFAVCSGGLHPGLVPKLVKILGRDIIIQAGGGIWGHPSGGRAGAAAMRQAVDAAMHRTDLKEYAKNKEELRLALKKWS
jgi:ribulose-bisphosphate carboxylase large chain